MVRRLIYKILGSRRKKTDQKPAAPEPAKKQSRNRNRKRKPRQKADRWTLDSFKVKPEEGKVRFHDLEIHERIMHAIHDLGFEYCTPIQAKVLAHASDNHNIAGRAQTGTGKTAAFLITLFSRFLANSKREKPRPGFPRALVLAPTRELVLQIESDARELAKYTPFRTIAVYGGSDIEKMKREIRGKGYRCCRRNTGKTDRPHAPESPEPSEHRSSYNR